MPEKKKLETKSKKSKKRVLNKDGYYEFLDGMPIHRSQAWKKYKYELKDWFEECSKNQKVSLRGRVVHHIDGNKLNNNMDNLLFLLTKYDHHLLHEHEQKMRAGYEKEILELQKANALLKKTRPTTGESWEKAKRGVKTVLEATHHELKKVKMKDVEKKSKALLNATHNGLKNIKIKDVGKRDKALSKPLLPRTKKEKWKKMKLDECKKHTKAWEKWTVEEDMELMEEVTSGKSPYEIAKKHGRSDKAILSRVQKLQGWKKKRPKKK